MARELAKSSDFKRIHVGCIITYKGMVIASGFNSNKTHPLQKKYNKFRATSDSEFVPKLHAEISALSKLRNSSLNPKRMKLFVYRIKQDGSYGMARPCPSCMQAIKDFGIRKIYYTTNDGFAKEILE